MSKFTVTVVRTETYLRKMTVEAESAEDAQQHISLMLAVEGWYGIEWDCDADGNYEDYSSDIRVSSTSNAQE